jgi:hypothetical protein
MLCYTSTLPTVHHMSAHFSRFCVATFLEGLTEDWAPILSTCKLVVTTTGAQDLFICPLQPTPGAPAPAYCLGPAAVNRGRSPPLLTLSE